MLTSFIYFFIIFLQTIGTIIIWAIFISILLNWFAQGRTNFGIMLEAVVQPILRPFRFLQIGPVNLAPIAVVLLIQFGVPFLSNQLLRIIAV